MTVQEAVLVASSLDLTVITAVPFALPSTKPVALTVATSLLSEDHSTSLFVALLGAIVAINASLSPLSNSNAWTFKLTPVTWTVLSLAVTVTVHVALILGLSKLETVMVASPAVKALTLPKPFTIATSSLSDSHFKP